MKILKTLKGKCQNFWHLFLNKIGFYKLESYAPRFTKFMLHNLVFSSILGLVGSIATSNLKVISGDNVNVLAMNMYVFSFSIMQLFFVELIILIIGLVYYILKSFVKDAVGFAKSSRKTKEEPKENK